MKIRKSAGVLVWNELDELALQLRASHDNSYPSHWDFSAAGGMNDEEDPTTAATRELLEEIGISGKLIFFKEEIFFKETSKDHLFLFVLQHNGPFTLDANEVADVQYFSEEKINTMLNSGAGFHPKFVKLWREGKIHQALKTVKHD